MENLVYFSLNAKDKEKYVPITKSLSRIDWSQIEGVDPSVFKGTGSRYVPEKSKTELVENIPDFSTLNIATNISNQEEFLHGIRIGIMEYANTTPLKSDNEYDYLTAESGMNIIMPNGGRIDEMRFRITLKAEKPVFIIDGFPKDLIENKYIIEGTIKIGVNEALKLIPDPIVQTVTNLIKIDLNPWSFHIGKIRNVKVDFSGPLTSMPEWYYHADGIDNDLMVTMTIKKPKALKKINAEVQAAWYYNPPGLTTKHIIQSDTRVLKIL
jgi:hypothetical protein